MTTLHPFSFGAVSLGALLLLGASVTAQGPVHFSGYFGGSGTDRGLIIRRGSNGEITLVGYTKSDNLPTNPNVMQTDLAKATPTPAYGDIDAFVARFVPAQPGPGYALQWCTYVGGTGIEFPFDAEVDANGITTVVGITTSPSVPFPTPIPWSLNGPSDGFLVQIDPTGSVCLNSMLFGGPDHDRINEVELVSNSVFGDFMIAGITYDIPNATSLPAATNAHHGGGTDAFAARVTLGGAAPVYRWSTYLGGSNHESLPFSTWLANTSTWMGNLDRMTMTLSRSGEPVVVTSSRNPGAGGVPAWTSPNAYQSTYAAAAGKADNYFVVLDPATGSLPNAYATLFGSSRWERPMAIAEHPAGGFVFGGITASANLPTTPGSYKPVGNGDGQWDSFVCWLNPSLTGSQQLRYGTYFGRSTLEDGLQALAVDSAGVVTIGGYAVGDVPTTPRCWQAAPVGSVSGYVARLELAGQGTRDLHYSTYAAPLTPGTYGTMVLGVAIDDLGDAWFTGSTGSSTYPVVNCSSSHAGGYYDAFLTHLQLLPGGVQREEIAFGTPTCGTPFVPMHTGVVWPASPNTEFGITVTDAPPNAMGVLVLGLPRATPLGLPPHLGGWLLVDSIANVVLTSNQQGYTRFDLHLPQGPAGPLTWGFGAQWLFLTNPACPGTGPLGNSERLRF